MSSAKDDAAICRRQNANRDSGCEVGQLPAFHGAACLNDVVQRRHHFQARGIMPQRRLA